MSTSRHICYMFTSSFIDVVREGNRKPPTNILTLLRQLVFFNKAPTILFGRHVDVLSLYDLHQFVDLENWLVILLNVEILANNQFMTN